MTARKRDSLFPALTCESFVGQIKREKAAMTTAKLVKWVRDPRSGAFHLPSEEVRIVSIMRNLDRTLK